MRRSISVLLVLMMVFALVAMPVSAEENITVLLNGQPLTFDVPPALINDRTMVPMRAIFEALNAKVAWNDQNEAVIGVNAEGTTRVVVAIGNNTAMVNDSPVEIDQPPVLMNDRTLVPLRFISEAFDCEVGWDEATSTVTIDATAAEKSKIVYLGAGSFEALGCWTLEGTTILKGKTNSVSADITTDDAIAEIQIEKAGQYKVWVNSRDYAANMPGSRYFNVAVDGVRGEKTFGTHGKEGFLWEELGVYDFAEGTHQIALQDTSGFYGRCEGIIVTSDMDYTPSSDYEEYSQYLRDERFHGTIPAYYPAWAKAQMANETTETIENDKIKVVFYQGQGERGNLIQNEIYMKKNGAWVLVKEKSEDLGVLAMRANETVVSTKRPGVVQLSDLPNEAVEQTYEGAFGTIHATNIESFYKMGTPEWLIPTNMTKTDNNTVVLGCSSDNVDATLTFTLDELTFEPKVTMNATMKTAGAYSFVYFTGDDFKDGSFSRVTAPLTYTGDSVMQEDQVLAEYMMFTPMCTFTFGEGDSAVTKGIVVDPTCVQQYVATPGLSDFGIMFRSPTGGVRGQIVAPLFGTEKSIFDQNSQYSFSYRLVYNDMDWYDNYKHVSKDMYNFTDLRTNYYASINDAIYNATDLIMDDAYGGWDDKDMAFYNMEAEMVTTISNGVELMQRYMLTDDKSILEERAVPALAFMLSRGGMHFKRVEGNNSYTANTPTSLSGVNEGFSPSSYVGLYEMSQGRTPYLLNLAVSRLNSTSNLNGVSGNQAMNDLFANENYVENIKKSADEYLKNIGSDSSMQNSYRGGFIYSNTVPMLNTFVKAYEVTGEQKYLDAATEIARVITTEVWTTGYQNDYATTDYTVDPVKTAERPLANDTANWFFHKNGVKWRVGNPVGVRTTITECENQLKEETAPGWLPARAGMGTEHLMTPSNGNAITMNMWAGTMLRLAKYTGEEYFETMARNSMVGRFGNYGGYYWERYLLHDKQEDYPYVGPDYDMIYWHHIPVFLGMMEDFLINTVWSKSEMNIEFPSMINAGYAYFVTNQYGYAPGKFYDEDGMWLWLDRGIIEPDTDEVDYITAKKDGVLGLALVNEGNDAVTTTVTLGEKIPNAASYSETATLYDKDGNKSTVEIANGKFTVTIPAKGIQSVVLHPQVNVPSFAKDYTVSTSFGNTVASHNSGKAYLLQFNDDEYYAYVYTSKMPKEIASATISYTTGGKSYTETINEYPFEKIFKVDAKNDFTYKMTVKTVDGKTEDLGGGTLSPLKADQITPYEYGHVEEEEVSSALPEFEAFSVPISGMGSSGNTIRVVVPVATFPFDKVTVDYMTGAKVKALLTERVSGEKRLLESVVIGNEVRDNGTIVLKVRETAQIVGSTVSNDTFAQTNIMILPPKAKFEDYKIDGEDSAATPSNPNQGTTTPSGNAALKDFAPFSVKYTGQGVSNGFLRFVVPKDQIPFECTTNLLKGVKATIVSTVKATGKQTTYETVLEGNEVRDTAVVLVVVAPNGLPAADYDNDKVKTHTFEITLSPAD